MMRILLCVPPAVFSVAELSNGYRDALRRAGHDVREYKTRERMAYHRRAAGEDYENEAWKHACETILQEAIYHRADLVLFICGLSFHPIALQLLQWGGFKVAVLHTESPYQDDEQIAWNAYSPGLTVFTHEKVSAERYGWGYLPHAYDPHVHRPVDPDPAEACDVLFVGTGWKERQAFLEAVDWSGIHVRIRGLWKYLTPSSPLWPHFIDGHLENTALPRLYASAKVCINLHRQSEHAVSLNPRSYELAACGVFQVTDARRDGSLFASVLPTFRTPQDLERQIRYYLAHPDQRQASAELAQQMVQAETFDARAAALIEAITPRFKDADRRLDEAQALAVYA